MNKWFKEPLLHFLLIGALLFGLYSLVNPEDSSVSDNRIVISVGDIERLSANWAKKWQRPPTETELQGLIDSYIREEVYYREALALGLDQNDTVLRRRMMQKMEFLSDDLADLREPDEATLKQYFYDNRNKYLLPEMVSFTHVYFSFDKHGDQILETSEHVLADLKTAASPVLRAPEKGDSFMLQYDFTLEARFEIIRLFGQDFAEQLFKLEKGFWQGPLMSGYGLHLVRINDKVEASMPEFAVVMKKVSTDWMFEQRQKTSQAIYERLKDRYEIVIEHRLELSDTVMTTRTGGESS